MVYDNSGNSEVRRLTDCIRQIQFIAQGRDENDRVPQGITTDWRRILNLTRQALADPPAPHRMALTEATSVAIAALNDGIAAEVLPWFGHSYRVRLQRDGKWTWAMSMDDYRARIANDNAWWDCRDEKEWQV